MIPVERVGARPLSPPEVAALAVQLAEGAPASALAIHRNWGNLATVETAAAGGRRYYAYPAARPACVYAVIPATGRLQLESAWVAWVGDLAQVPRSTLPPGPLRLQVFDDRRDQIAHLNPHPLVRQYVLDELPPVTMPAGVDVADAPAPDLRPLWHALWIEDELARGSTSTDDEIREAAERELAATGNRWFTVREADTGRLVAGARALDMRDGYLALAGAYVVPARRGLGYGAMLVRARLADGAARGLTRAISQTAMGNDASTGNLLRAGFRRHADTLIVP